MTREQAEQLIKLLFLFAWVMPNAGHIGYAYHMCDMLQDHFNISNETMVEWKREIQKPKTRRV